MKTIARPSTVPAKSAINERLVGAHFYDTRAEKAEDLALLRSAELTLKNGFTHFVIIDSQSREKHDTYTTPTQSYTTANATAYGNTASGTAQTTSYGGQTFNISKPTGRRRGSRYVYCAEYR